MKIYEDDVQTCAREACRLEHKLTSTSRVHPDKYACIQPKNQKTRQETNPNRHTLLYLREAVLLA